MARMSLQSTVLVPTANRTKPGMRTGVLAQRRSGAEKKRSSKEGTYSSKSFTEQVLPLLTIAAPQLNKSPGPAPLIIPRSLSCRLRVRRTSGPQRTTRLPT
jgi:hypothetical protein